MSKIRKSWLASVFLAGLALPLLPAGATDISRSPLQADGLAKPNVIFGMDDSGSMDFEVLLPASDGAFWWDESERTGWESDGDPIFNTNGANGGNLHKLVYLFPNGCGAGQRVLCDASNHFPIPPTPQFASLRSARYNPLYYDPDVTYAPWPTATVSGTSRSFGNANPDAALSHPLFNGTIDLTEIQYSTKVDMVYTLFKGMTVPSGASVYNTRNGNWEPQTTSVTVNTTTKASIPYFPASYWNPQICTANGTTCVAAPNGKTLKLYEIKQGNTYPSGRGYAAELQNFANWFTYYRKRKLMLAGSMGQVLDSLTGMRVGLVQFNSLSAVTMYDTDVADPLANGKVVAGRFYANPSSGGTPTRETLKYIGEQFSNNKNVIQYSCQRNAAFVVTDGFANASSVVPPAYDAKLFGKGRPYETTHPKTLGDIALSYYTNNLRADLTKGRVPSAKDSLDPAADKNDDPHMNTYGITLGASGVIWPGISDAYKNAVTWPNPTVNLSPSSVDDLWHATVNGRGAMFRATNPRETALAVQTALTQILRLSGSQSGVTYSTVNLKASDSFAYVGSYKPLGWSGDIESFAVDPATGSFAANPTWSANAKLIAQDWTTRKIVTFNGSRGVSLNAASLSSNANMAAYLRGDRSLEVATYRQRTGLMGAVVNAEPVISAVDGVLYAPTNEGMLHALDKATGEELWAYAPSFGRADMLAQSAKNAVFQTILDGTPVIAKVGPKTLLVGGRGTAGAGFYALDVTAPKSLVSEADVAARVLWEFPGASTPPAVRAALGTSVGRPVLVTTAKYGAVVLLTSGYNGNHDGKGHVFVLDALTGSLRLIFVTSEGSPGADDAGLAQLSGFQEKSGLVRFVYGGDEKGNLWRFDLDTSALMKLATLTNKQGAALPITAAPELTVNPEGRRLVLVGTGRLLANSDFADNRVQSFFGLWDNNTPISDVRTQLATRTLTVKDSLRNLTGPPVNWGTQRGWVVDLPAGEKVNTDPTVAYSVLAFTSNKPSLLSCSSSSALYLADISSGQQLGAGQFLSGLPYFGIEFASTLASRPSIARTTAGKVAVTSRQSDGTNSSRLLNISSPVTPQKTAWKEVLR